MTAALIGYAVIAPSVGHRWISGVVAPAVAVLLWRRHPRARFAAYIFLSAVGVRAALEGQWPALLFAATAILVLQTPAARRVWPRLSLRWPGRLTRPTDNRERDDRMSRP
jgi:hypothetical protein